MNCITLTDFRASLYACFDTACDTLLNIVDALATETVAQSLPELSLSTFFPRQWSSLYQGLQHARIDRSALRRLFAAHAPQPTEGTRLVLGIDARFCVRVPKRHKTGRMFMPVTCPKAASPSLPAGSSRR